MKKQLRTCWRVSGNQTFFCFAAMALAVALGLGFSAQAFGQVPEPPPPPAPGALNTVPVPMPADLGEYVSDMAAVRALGKALFWDMQAGGDGRTACATCHFHAGTDARPQNTIGVRDATFRGANKTLTAADFPIRTSEVVGGQGVIKRDFLGINMVKNSVNPVDKAKTVPDAVFNVGGVNTRQVTGRNTPTNFNAIFNDRQFWDGRANHVFNGQNPLGDLAPGDGLWKYVGAQLTRVHVLTDNASLASQAVGPPNNNVEMSWNGRTFPELGKKMCALKPLALQKVHANDSLLGPQANTKGKGLTAKNYAELVRKAFRPEWWSSPGTVDGKFTQMEFNFSLFWGLSINLYEALLVSDDSPFDRFARGNSGALSAEQKTGMDIFMGKCAQCHSGPEFTSASVSNIGANRTELFPMAAGGQALVDTGFLNIGVRPTANDLGNGRGDLPGPISVARRTHPGDLLAVDGAMKVPTVRNVELTGPYFHNGGRSTLTQVVELYANGADFANPELAAGIGIGKIRGKPDRIAAVVAFLKALTDDRVRMQKAPFDHPEIIVPNGHSGFSKGVAVDNNVTIHAVGAGGGPAIHSFEEILNGASL